MTSIPVSEISEWSEADVENEIELIDEMKFVPFHYKEYRKKLESALKVIYDTRERLFKTLEKGEW